MQTSSFATSLGQVSTRSSQDSNLDKKTVGFDLADQQPVGVGGDEGSSSFYSGLLSTFFHSMYGNILFVNGLFLLWNTVSVEK